MSTRAGARKPRDYQTLSTPEVTPEVPDDAERWALPRVRTALSAADVVARLDRAARRGGLPGFETEGSGDFRVAVFGNPFDRELVATIAESDGGSEIAFRPTLQRKAPTVLIASVVISIWPGIEFVDILTPTSWWPTWTWYLPLVIVPTVLMAPGMWKKSEKAAAQHAREQITTIAKRVEGEVVPDSGAPRREEHGEVG